MPDSKASSKGQNATQAAVCTTEGGTEIIRTKNRSILELGGLLAESKPKKGKVRIKDMRIGLEK